MAKRITRRQEFDKACETGDWSRWDKIKHWCPGGRRRHHAALQRARRLAEKMHHSLRPFKSGVQIHGDDGDPDIYISECRYCKRSVTVCFGSVINLDTMEKEVAGYGFALTTKCGEPFRLDDSVQRPAFDTFRQ